jgi:hypothetical protein
LRQQLADPLFQVRLSPVALNLIVDAAVDILAQFRVGVDLLPKVGPDRTICSRDPLGRGASPEPLRLSGGTISPLVLRSSLWVPPGLAFNIGVPVGALPSINSSPLMRSVPPGPTSSGGSGASRAEGGASGSVTKGGCCASGVDRRWASSAARCFSAVIGITSRDRFNSIMLADGLPMFCSLA